MEKILDGLSWTVEGFHKNVPLQRVTMETGVTHKNLTGVIPATVPGSLHTDLYNAEQIPHPYINMNSLHAEWTENRWWVYRTEFDAPKNYKKVELIFKGLDYDACVILNNMIKAEHMGTFSFLRIDISDECKKYDKIKLDIIFKAVPNEIGQVGRTSLTTTQKPRFGYKWDFSCRLVNIGFWREIILKTSEEYSLEDIYIRSGFDGTIGKVAVSGILEPHTNEANDQAALRIALYSGLELVTEKLTICKNGFNTELTIDNPRLWNVNGMGDAYLYKLVIEVSYQNKIVDCRQYTVGIRSISYALNDSPAKNPLPYTFVINGRKVYVKGVNFTPLDHVYGSVTPRHYEQMILTAKNMNVNMIRVWGGGLIEREEFYDLCDKHGILVFQEFIQSSSGIDNVPCKTPQYLEILRRCAMEAVKEKRNHTCLAVWCGGNELMDETGAPTDYTDANISMLRGIVEKYDPGRLFLPTSASGPSEGLSDIPNESHDIHGAWEYLGNPRHYEKYFNSDSLFHGEFGTEGFTNLKTIRKFVDEIYLVPMDVNDHVIWKHRGQWWGTYSRDLLIFGEIYDIRHFQNMSQWLQAEGLRFILEQNRSRKYQNSGSLIWQFNEPWPNINGTFLVDYCMEQKQAYYWAKKANEPVHVCLRYKKLDYAVGSDFWGALYVNNSDAEKCLDLAITLRDTQGSEIYSFSFNEFICKENSSFSPGELSFEITPDFNGLFFVSLELFEAGSRLSDNLYIFSTEKEFPYKSANRLRNSCLSATLLSETDIGGGFISQKYSIKNNGSYVALHIRAIEISDAFWCYWSNMFDTLFPGESRQYTVTMRRKSPSGFMIDNYDQEAKPEFVFESF